MLLDVAAGFLTRDEFVMLYDRCSEVLHSRNPFRSEPAVINFERSLQEWVDRSQKLLSIHLMQVAGSGHVWLVQMKHPTDGKVHAAIAEPPETI